ncbi:hypothetical protein BDZ94DRAFT_1241627, partial [Collybia nuda]
TVPGCYQFLKQGVTITGEGTPTFNDSIRAATEIYGFFDRCFPEGTMESWSCADELSNERDAIHASNRYLTPKMEASRAKHQAFGKSVDPKGILESMTKEGYIHTEDNVVQYSRRRVQPDGKFIYKDIGPQAFRIGDIVEIQVSFVVVPLKEERVKMITVLRCITLLEACTTMAPATRPSVNAVTLKHRIGHDPRIEAPKRNKMVIDSLQNWYRSKTGCEDRKGWMLKESERVAGSRGLITESRMVTGSES